MYDIAIIGAGAAGIACAKSAAKGGLKAVLIDSEKDAFGGICLNSGCIPTKTFLLYTKLNKTWQDSFVEKEKNVEQIKTALFSFLKNNNVDIFWGQAKFLDVNTVDIDGKEISAKYVIIATGSRPKSLLNHPKVIFSEQLLDKRELPSKILIIGAGYIGIEFASLLCAQGKTVYVVEKEETILPNFDAHISARLRIILEKKGIKIDTASNISNYNLDSFDMVLSAVGRLPNIENLNLGKVGIAQDKDGWIKTDKSMRTNIKNIYACGDVTGKKLLAYIAEYQAQICIDNIKGISAVEDYSGIPECVFSIPEVAFAGMTEEEARKKNIKYTLLKSNFLKFSSTYVYNDLDGFIQLIVGQDDRIIGVGIISNMAAELVSLFSFSIRNNTKVSDLKKCIFVHPTLSEIIPLFLNF